MSCLEGLTLLSKHHNVLFGQAVLVMGSNYQAKKNFAYAKKALLKVGNITELPLVAMGDYTQKTCTLYHNQAVIFCPNPDQNTKLNQSLVFEHFLKTLEQDCLRQKHTPYISLDLDILLLKAKYWYAIKERYPFRHHELCCLGFAKPPEHRQVSR